MIIIDKYMLYYSQVTPLYSYIFTARFEGTSIVDKPMQKARGVGIVIEAIHYIAHSTLRRLFRGKWPLLGVE